jgi:hypothetical protein
MTTRPPDETLQLHNALRTLSPVERSAALIVSLIADDESPAVILTLCATAAQMVRHLPISIQTRVAWHLAEILEELNARWN